MKYSYNPPALLKKLFPNFIWESQVDKVLLTFDDGPNSNTTEIILKQLCEKNIKGVFFCVGENLKKFESLAKEILSEGHVLGNHSFKHQRFTTQNYLETKESLQKVQNFANERLDYNIQFLRPPHGRFTLRTSKLCKELNLKNVMWSLLTYDYKNDLNIVKLAVEKYLIKNSIIVLHDSMKSKEIIIDSINVILDELDNKEYQIGSPTECLKSYF